jgi:hypothetical protein
MTSFVKYVAHYCEKLIQQHPTRQHTHLPKNPVEDT